jgi:pyrophosphatase PpaX
LTGSLGVIIVSAGGQRNPLRPTRFARSRHPCWSGATPWHDELTITGARGAPRGIDTVVFDFDDTLAETLPARVAAMRRAFEQAGVREPDAEWFVHDQRGIPLQTSMEDFDGGRGKELGLLDFYRTAYWHKEPGVLSLFEGVPELIDALASAGLGMGIFTSKVRDFVVEGRPAGTVVELGELGLAHLAGHTIGFEDVTNPTPHPEGLERLLGMLGASPSRTLVVGDSHADILAAQAAGCWSCLAGWGVVPGERRLDAARPDVIAEHPAALQRLLAG